MLPSKIVKMHAKVYGGDTRGSVTSLTPTKLSEVLAFFKEANMFINSSDARMLEITMINAEGAVELRNMYKNKALADRPVTPEKIIEDSEFWHAFNMI